MIRVHAIGAHFDDVEIGCGGTLAARRFEDLHIAVLRCEDGRAGDPRIRCAEQDAARALLGDPPFHPFRYGDIAPVVDDLERMKPDILFAPWPQDTHQDHRFAGEVALSMSRRSPRLLVAFYDAGTSLDFKPNCYHRIPWEAKAALLACFPSQLERMPWLPDFLEARERAHGLRRFREGHAEAFYIPCFDAEVVLA